MNVEDLIIALVCSRIPLNDWDSKMMHSFYDQISRGNGFTEKQSTVALKTLNRHSASLGNTMGKDLTSFLSQPVFRLPIRKITNDKKLTVVADPMFGKVIKAVFPYNDKTVEKIRQNRDSTGHAQWDKEEKCWTFSLSEYNIQFLMNLDTFDYDETFQDYVDQVKKIQAEMESHVPILCVQDNKPVFKNCHQQIKNLETVDLLEAVFEARKSGVTFWDETISDFLESDQVDKLTNDFLKSNPGEKFSINSEKYELSALGTIVNHLFPVLVVIPGGREFQELEKSHKFFEELGVANDDMSVMFRLPTETHAQFNTFVRDVGLNSPITETTKVVFISGKLPKPVIKSRIKFHCMLNLGYSNVHYTIRDFTAKHENLIYYSREKY